MTARRVFLRSALLGGAGLIADSSLAAQTRSKPPGKPKEKDEDVKEEVSPAEDLMREHGVLKRVILVYRDVVRRLRAGEELPRQQLADAAGVIRSFIEEYHEKLEEEHLFPRFRRAGKLVELVDVLQAQHAAGRKLTEATLAFAKGAGQRSADERRHAADDLAAFIRMYEPHEAREDTVLFPALRTVVSGHEYDALGEEFEKKEHQLFGKDGFEGMVERVAGIEKRLGLYDLAQFTPKA